MVPKTIENICRGELRLRVVALNEGECPLNPEQEHRDDDRWERVFTRGCVENRTKNEECRQRRHDSSHNKLCDERGDVELNAREPWRADPATRERQRNAE